METWIVRWSIDIEADTAEEAARKALEIQRDPESIAVVFEVSALGSGIGRSTRVDLQKDNDVRAAARLSHGALLEAASEAQALNDEG